MFLPVESKRAYIFKLYLVLTISIKETSMLKCKQLKQLAVNMFNAIWYSEHTLYRYVCDSPKMR
jgi:hypothetical protein